MDQLLVVFENHKIASVVALLGVALLVEAWLRRDRRLDTIPGPRGYPLIGIGIFLPFHTPSLFYDWAFKYGDIFRVRLGLHNLVFINTPRAVQEILEKQAVHTSSKVPSPMSHGIVTAGKRMPSMPYGPHWRAQRSVVRVMTSVPMTSTFLPCQEYEAKQLLFDLATNNENQRDFYEHTRRFAFSIIMTNTFGSRVKTLDHPDAVNAMKIQDILRDHSKPGDFLVDDLPPLQRLPKWLQPGHKRANKAGQQVYDMRMALWQRLEKMVEDGTAPHCYAREIIEKKESWYRAGLDDEDLAWVGGGMVEAGFGTTAVALNTVVLYLMANPKVQDTAREELLRVVGPDRLPTFADMRNLPYIRACVKETLRINPMLYPGVQHYTDADVVFQNHVIPKGTILITNTAFLNFDPSRYENPFEFMPERYINHRLYSSEYAAMGDPYARDHFIFSAGRRVCPGARLAENSLDIALACMLWAFEIRPPLVDGVETPVRIDNSAFQPGPFHIPKPFGARFVPRDDATLTIIKEQWDIAMRDGYELRGTQVDIDGVVKD